MPFKLIGTIILLVLITIFCGFNLEEANKCDINLIFHVFEKVPVFLTVLTSFLAGIVVMLPFAFFRKKKCRDSQKTKKTETAKLAESAESKEINGKADSTYKNEEQEKTIFDFKIRKPVTKNSKKEKKSASSEEEKEEAETSGAGSLS